jgi:hypothetical protein
MRHHPPAFSSSHGSPDRVSAPLRRGIAIRKRCLRRRRSGICREGAEQGEPSVVRKKAKAAQRPLEKIG